MRISDRWAFGGLAVAPLGLLAGGLILGEIFRIQPCYWCNFQRLLYMILAFLGFCGVLLPGWRRAWSPLLALTALGGVLAAGRQSWMQYAPQDTVECGFGDPTLVEQLVDWLSGLWPSMFMVTGLCKEKDWVFLGLTLANWSGVCFFALFCASLWMLFHRAP
jgi:disulfide bond formation protein DsbB